MTTNTRKIYLCMSSLFLTLLLSSCAGVPKWDLPSAFSKGTVTGKWGAEALESSEFRKNIKDLKKSSGIDYMQIDVVEYQVSVISTDICLLPNSRSHINYKRMLDEAQRDRDKLLSRRIKQVHNLGLKVVLVPKIEIIDKSDGMYGRSDIGFTSEDDWNKWFSEYERFILHYAKLARRRRVEVFSIGAGLSFTLDRTDKWKQIVDKVKRVYRGDIIYAANKDSYPMLDEWDNIDYVGINMNYPVVHSSHPTLNELRQGFYQWSDSIDGWMPKINKGVFFVELGRDGIVERDTI